MEAAVNALCKGLAPAMLLEAMSGRWRSVLLGVRGLSWEPQQYERDNRLALAVLGRLGIDGFDAGPILVRMAREPDEYDRTVLAVCLLGYFTACGLAPPPEFDDLLGRGISNARSPEPLSGLLERLAPERRAAIVAHTSD